MLNILILEMADYLFDEAFLGVTFSPAQQSLSKASLSNDFLKLRAGDISCLTSVLKTLVGAASHKQFNCSIRGGRNTSQQLTSYLFMMRYTCYL